jgi:sugar O-acyltransferase (sialic acid O-acetyltransferase NeuD family)
MPEKKLVLIGGGGHCKSCIDVIESTGEWQISGIIDLPELLGNRVLNYEVIGADNDIDKWINSDTYFLITVGQIKSSAVRQRLFGYLKEKNALIATVISAKATVSKYASIGEGSIIHHHCIVNAEASIGANCIINTAANIEHEVKVDDHTHVSTGALINGNVTIGKGCFIGSGSILTHGISVHDGIIIGAGSLVIKNLDVPGIYVGVPCKKRGK